MDVSVAVNDVLSKMQTHFEEDWETIVNKTSSNTHREGNKIDTNIELCTAHILDNMNMKNDQLTAKIEEFMKNVAYQKCRETLDKQESNKQQVKPYKLGQSIFTLDHQIDIQSVNGDVETGCVSDIVMMDDGRLVMCLRDHSKLLVCDTDESEVDSIHVHGGPLFVTAVNNSTVAVLRYGSNCIEMYDINNKLKLKSIAVPGMWWLVGIATINDKLIVGGDCKLLIIDHQTEEVVQTIKTECFPIRFHGSGNRIFYINNNANTNKNLYWYSFHGDRHQTLTLPSPPYSITTLQDGSLYVVCIDGSVQHMSSDCTEYRPVTTRGLTKLKYLCVSYNPKQTKLITRTNQMEKLNIFYQK